VPFPGSLRSHCSPHADTCTDCHRYRHANKHTHQHAHAIPDPYGDENVRTIPNGYTYVSTH
jgi:hypothetical protein